MTKTGKIDNPISQGVQVRRIPEHPLSSIKSNELRDLIIPRAVHDAVWEGLTTGTPALEDSLPEPF